MKEVAGGMVAARPVGPVPAFAVRGVVQGFYGRTWTAEERRDTIGWLADHGMNTYVHAPKDDPYQRAQWRDPWPPALLAELLEEVGAARRVGVNWVPNLSPAVPVFPGTARPGDQASRDICFSSEEDRELLRAKLDPFVAAGARTVMLSFDDCRRSTHERDLAAYPAGELGAGAMTRDLLNAVHRRYARHPGGVRLLTVLEPYFGTDDCDYLRGVRAGGGLDDGIDVLWTGPQVVSTRVGAADAAAYARLVGRRRVLLWDNYPVNDYTSPDRVPTRLFLGPYVNRDPELPASVSGVLANPMSQALASRLALATVAEYLADPGAYRPERAWRRAVQELAGGDAELADAVAALAENCRSSPLSRRESPRFGAAVNRLLRELGGPFWTAAAAELAGELDRERRAPEVLRARHPGLAAETGPFLDRLAANARLAGAAAGVLAALRPALSARARRVDGTVRLEGTVGVPSPDRVREAEVALRVARADALADPVAVHGDRVGNEHFTIRPGQHRLDRLVSAAATMAADWWAAGGGEAAPLHLSAGGWPVPVGADGTFSVDLAAAPAGHPVEVVATDGAGPGTGLRLAPD